MRLTKWPGIERLGNAALSALVRGAIARDLPPDDLLQQISMESGFRAAAKNPNSSAAGLIQMINSSARTFAGVSSAKLARMNALQQVPGVLAYYTQDPQKLTPKLPPLRGFQFRLMGYGRSPVLLKSSDDRVLYSRGPATQFNPGAVEAGAITVGSIRREWDNYRAKYGARSFDFTPAESNSTQRKKASPSAFPVVALAAVAALGLAFTRRSRR